MKKSIRLLMVLVTILLSIGLFGVVASADTPGATPAPFDTNIDFPADNPNAYKIPMDTANSTLNPVNGKADVLAKINAGGVYIDLNEEKLYVAEGITIAAYSLDGSSWKAGSIGAKDGGDISKILNKESSLKLATVWDAKNKKPQVGAVAVAATETAEAIEAVEGSYVIAFPKIKARNAATKLDVSYSVYADPSGATAGQWVFADKGKLTAASTNLNKIQIAPSSDGKNPDDGKWGEFKTGEGISVKPLGDATKVIKDTYVYRYEPSMEVGNYAAASKTLKAKVSSELKAPSFKADYKKEILKVKEGANAYGGTALELKGKTSGPIADGDKATGIKAESGKYIASISKDNAKKGVELGEYLGTVSKPLTVWLSASDKKPASAKTEYKLAVRPTVEPQIITGNKGKVTWPKELEVLKDKAANKWSKPKFTKSEIMQVRLKSVAKAQKTGDDSEQVCASAPVDMDVTWGSYPSGKSTKNGVLKVNIGEYLDVVAAEVVVEDQEVGDTYEFGPVIAADETTTYSVANLFKYITEDTSYKVAVGSDPADDIDNPAGYDYEIQPEDAGKDVKFTFTATTIITQSPLKKQEATVVVTIKVPLMPSQLALAKITGLAVSVDEADNNEAAVTAAVVAAAQAKVDADLEASTHTVTATDVTYTVETKKWKGKFVVTPKQTAANDVAATGAEVEITITVIPAGGVVARNVDAAAEAVYETPAEWSLSIGTAFATGDEVTIDGVKFECVASGATADNGEFNLVGSNVTNQTTSLKNAVAAKASGFTNFTANTTMGIVLTEKVAGQYRSTSDIDALITTSEGAAGAITVNGTAATATTPAKQGKATIEIKGALTAGNTITVTAAQAHTYVFGTTTGFDSTGNAEAIATQLKDLIDTDLDSDYTVSISGAVITIVGKTDGSNAITVAFTEQ